jgi:hypothetical protein
MKVLDRPNVIALLLVLLALGYGGWTVYQQTSSANPDQQVFVREGVPPHRLNLWTRPQPAEVGEVTFVIEFDFVNLMNDQVDNLKLELSGPDNGDRRTLRPTFSETGAYEGRYHVSTTLEQSGKWSLTVNSTMSGTTKETNFEVPVQSE